MVIKKIKWLILIIIVLSCIVSAQEDAMEYKPCSEFEEDFCLAVICESELSALRPEADENWAKGLCIFVAGETVPVRYSKSKLQELDELVLPKRTGSDLMPISKEDVSCSNPLSLKLAWFNYLEDDWEIIEQSETQFFNDEESVVVVLNSEGIDWLVDKGFDYYYLAIIEERRPYALTDVCAKINCPRGMLTYTVDDYNEPYDSKLLSGNLEFRACPLPGKCNPASDGVCDRSCPQDMDPDCDMACTNKEGDCCDYSEDLVCDMDCPELDPDCACTIEADGCCSGLRRSYLSEELYSDPSLVHNCESAEDCKPLFECRGKKCLPPEGKDIIYSFDACKKITGQNAGSCIVDAGMFGDPDCAAEVYFRPSLQWGDKEIVGIRSSSAIVPEGDEDSSSIDIVYPGVFSYDKGFGSCDYRIDGFCDPDCPSYKINGKKFDAMNNQWENAIVTRYVDPDCCQNIKYILNDDGEQVKVEGLAAAENILDGCCKATCDGECDPDCLFGMDPDCNEGLKSPDEWFEEVNEATETKFETSDFYSGESDSKCFGCGNGRCEFNVWGGGRLEKPLFKNVWQTVPSFYNIINHNWNYADKGLEISENEGLPDLVTANPFHVWRETHMDAYMRSFCGKEWKYSHRIAGDCYRISYFDLDKNEWARNRKKGGFEPNILGQYSQEEEGFNLPDLSPLQNKFDENLVDETWFEEHTYIEFKPWATFYPFDETPENCPEDCSIEKTCPDEVCQPWEFLDESCNEDCAEYYDETQNYRKGQFKWPLVFWINQELFPEKEGYCISRKTYATPEYDISKNSPSKIYKNLINSYTGSRALCAFSHPGEQGNCPAGSVCGYNCECISLDDTKNILALIEGVKTDLDWNYLKGEDFYNNLNLNVDKDLDTFRECTEDEDPIVDMCDCDDSNTRKNPDAVDICDGIDNDCNGIVDDLNGNGIDRSACDEDLWVCRNTEFNSSLVEGEFVGCFEFCRRTKGSDYGVQGEVFSCSYDVTEDVGSYAFYVFLCDPDKPEEKCDVPYFTSTFTVCEETEAGLCLDGIDNDCDGKIDFQDEDCFTCNPDGAERCDLLNKKWCKEGAGENNVPAWVEDGYCGSDACGSFDSSCMSEAETCAEGELSCGKGCFPGSCDIYADKLCNENGVWSEAGYEEHCAVYDFDIEGDCEDDSCDYVNEFTCKANSWVLGDPQHCALSQACGQKYDSDCGGQCEPGACDTEKDKFCKSDSSWDSTDYCLHCGYTDASCGVQACEEGICDYSAMKVCEGGVWVEKGLGEYCAFWESSDKCSIDPLHYCTQEECVPTVPEGEEEDENMCDGLDNDCDGTIDEKCECMHGVEIDCGFDVGLCEKGVQKCEHGFWGECLGGVEPLMETCNGFDDDCDDSIDEGCDCVAGEVRSCGRNDGSCSKGLQRCDESGKWSTCYGTTYVTSDQAEICDGIDNDCDTLVDEGCICTPGETQPCGSNEGRCEKGVQTCSNNGWGVCTGGKNPLPEICDDSLDNDCDGKIDKADDDCIDGINDISDSCFDHIKNQGEDEIDCGGPCSPCEDVTCNDRKMNGDEEFIDCGGSVCSPCKKASEEKADAKDATTQVQLTAVCGDGYCEGDEDEYSCPDDCSDEKEGLPIFNLVLAFIFLLVLGGAGFAVFNNIKNGRKPLDVSWIIGNLGKKKIEPAQKQVKGMLPPSQISSSEKSYAFKKKDIKSREEKALEESLRKSKKMFK